MTGTSCRVSGQLCQPNSEKNNTSFARVILTRLHRSRQCENTFYLFDFSSRHFMSQRHQRRLVALAVTHGFTYYREILHGVGQFARDHLDWELTSLVPELGHSPSTGGAAVDGAIAAVGTTWLSNYFSRWKSPVVNVDAVLPGLTFPRVGVDNAAIGEMAVQHFLDRGLKNFAFVGHRDWQYSREREEAFCSILQRAGYSRQRLSQSQAPGVRSSGPSLASGSRSGAVVEAVTSTGGSVDAQ